VLVRLRAFAKEKNQYVNTASGGGRFACDRGESINPSVRLWVRSRRSRVPPRRVSHHARRDWFTILRYARSQIRIVWIKIPLPIEHRKAKHSVCIDKITELLLATRGDYSARNRVVRIRFRTSVRNRHLYSRNGSVTAVIRWLFCWWTPCKDTMSLARVTLRP
jgi:hypothetical protein